MKISTPERMRVAYLKDLSEGGVFIRTDKPLALERVVDVDLLAPGRIEPIRLRGRITRVQNDEASKLANLQGMGVKFIEVTPQADTALKALVHEYATQSRPAVPVPSAVPDGDTVALKQALETAEVLRSTLTQRETELNAEHERRQELSVRVITLTQELELIKAKGSDGQSVALDALKVELQASRAELGELKARLQAAEGNAESYRQEIAVLEQDDATTRRLAETLAQQKAKAESELKRARDELAQHAQAVEA
ncbi:MAG: PilZ domain-containing protein, partial [Myxococcaceae bacterium]|nr:PilZ domain-containing protein [Myxococcaceae bacterium]